LDEPDEPEAGRAGRGCPAKVSFIMEFEDARVPKIAPKTGDDRKRFPRTPGSGFARFSTRRLFLFG
jgi:hypothetical protein